ncbi:MAG: class I SAM-dependent RNA methyltransferase [Anaerolineae bacterium]|nr:class I SAM-dependent RNA methyltransferase [Anaerolineae bacterium]
MQPPAPQPSDELITLELTGIAHGGSAIGRHEGRAVFVPYAIPGETIRARIIQDKGRYAIAQSVEVLSASPARIEPRCPHFGPGRCGGCHWQHIDIETQLRLKEQIVREQLARLGGQPDAPVHPTLASPSPWEYRSHITVRISEDGRAGFVRTDGRTILPVEQCHIIPPALLEMLQQLEQRGLKPGSRWRIQMGADGVPVAFPLGDGGAVASEFEAETSSSGMDTTADYTNFRSVTYQIKGRAFRCSPGSFFQVNTPQAERLVDLVLEYAAPTADDHILDLYAGGGLFSAFLAERCRRVSAVESFPQAIDDAEANLAHLDNVRLYSGTVERVLPRLTGPFQAAVVDPPRAGMEASALKALIEHRPDKIVYVSCDPATLARDTRRLVEAGYHLDAAQPLDMFPQTYHIETVAAFHLKTKEA